MGPFEDDAGLAWPRRALGVNLSLVSSGTMTSAQNR
jgi:hypothetical protein